MDDDHQGCSYVQDVLVEDLDKADHAMIDTAEMVGNPHIRNPGMMPPWELVLFLDLCERGDLMLRNVISCVGTEIFAGEIQRNLCCTNFSASATH